MMILTLGLTAAMVVSPLPPERVYGPYTADQTEFVGYVRFSNGEFQLYGDQDDVRRPLGGGACVSGAASDGEMRQARGDLSGQKVRIVGVTAPWSEAQNGRIEHRRSDIRNDCAGAFVIKADDIQPAN